VPDRVPEATTAYLTLTFLNKLGVPDQPNTASYTIHDRKSKGEIRAVTPLVPGTSIEIVLTPTDNALVDQTAEREFRVVTTHAEYGAEDALNGRFVYEVVNLDQWP